MGLLKFIKRKVKTFCGFDSKDPCVNFEDAKAVILQCPYDLTASYKKGARKGPRAILAASASMETFDEELKEEICRIGIHTKPPMRIQSLPPDEMVRRVKIETEEILRANKLPVIIGGEHSVSIGAVWAVSELRKNFCVLQLDAHHDLRNRYRGSEYNHACVARRFLEYCPVVQVGTRSLCKEEQDFIDGKPACLKIFGMQEILKTALWKEAVIDSLLENVYISLDLDVFDLSIIQSVGTPEPGGLGWFEALDFLRLLALHKRIIGFDVTELLPVKYSINSDFSAARLIYKLLGYIFLNKNQEKERF